MLAHKDDRAREIIEDSMEYLMESRQLALLRSVLIELNPVDIAEILDDFKTEDLLKIYRLLPKDMATDVFVYLPPEVSQSLLTRLSDSEAGAIIDDLYADDAADLLDEMPSMVVKKLLANAKPETRANVNHLLQFAEDSAGSIMTVEFVDLKEFDTVNQAIAKIRRVGIDKETINSCFVLDSARKLLGIVTLRKLLLASPEDKVGELMDDNVIIVRTNTDQEEVARLFKKYDFTSMPVCDSENRLVGIVTVDDIVDIIEEETEEDFSKMAAMAPIEDEYLKTSSWKHSKGRILWLLFLMISSTFTGLMIQAFEAELTTFLLAFTPLLMGTAGNCGAQSSTTVIRALALDQISTKDFIKVTLKEGRIALICSAILAVANAVRVVLIYWWDPVINQDLAVLKIALILGLSLIGIVLLAQVIGAMLPILAKKIKVDPALMSTPVITTIMDTLSILLYCLIIMWTSSAFGWSF
ncbi:MAG: magnesium transporter [Clostridia bacterium]|nr:magnesium transporter [Clostridia bacterium]